LEVSSIIADHQTSLNQILNLIHRYGLKQTLIEMMELVARFLLDQAALLCISVLVAILIIAYIFGLHWIRLQMMEVNAGISPDQIQLLQDSTLKGSETNCCQPNSAETIQKSSFKGFSAIRFSRI